MPSSLGGNLIESASLFEVAAAELISAEARFLDRLLDLNPPGWVLLNASAQIQTTINYLRWLEEAIVENVENGIDTNSTE